MKNYAFKFLLFSNFLMLAMGFAQVDEWITYTTDDGLPGTWIREITIEQNGMVWVGTQQNGLGSFDGESWTTYDTTNSGLPDNTVYSIEIDSDNLKWIGTGGGMVTFDGVNWDQVTSNATYAITITHSGQKWIAATDGLTFIDESNTTLYPEIAGNWVRKIAIDENMDAWLGHAYGLIHHNRTDWTIYGTENSGLPMTDLKCVTLDSEETKWIGTANSYDFDGLGGVSSFDGDNWVNYTIHNSELPNNLVLAIAIDEEDTKWIGTYSGALAEFDGTNWTIHDSTNSDLPTSWGIRDIAIDPFGNKWLATRNGGVSVYNEGGVVVAIDDSPEKVETPGDISLYQNYPNPFNPSTSINYELPETSIISLTVFDARGQVVTILQNGVKAPGNYEVQWSGADERGNQVSAGVYFCLLDTGDFSHTIKMVYLK